MTMAATCTTKETKGSVQSNEILRPYRDVRKGIYYALRGSVLRLSRNNRTFYSKYHRPGMNLKLSAYKQKTRGQVVMTILGDRRPYRLAVQYRIEELRGGNFTLVRYDKGLAEKYLEKVNTYLSARPEDRDMIDDFKPY